MANKNTIQEIVAPETSDLLKEVQKYSNVKPNPIDKTKPLTSINSAKQQSKIGDTKISTEDLNVIGKYLSPYGGIYPGTDFREKAAQVQTTGNKWFNGVVKFTGRVGTSFLEPFVDIGYGIPSIMATGKFSALYDNDITQAFDEFNNHLQKQFPNFYTHAETDSKALSLKNLTSANFWADKVLGGAAFTVGTLLNAYATAGIGTALRGGAALKAFRAGFKEMSLAAETENALKAISSKAARVRTGDAIQNLATTILSVAGESGVEARDLGNTLKAQMADYVKQGLISQEEASRQIENAMNLAFAANVAIVGTSQFIQFGKLYSRGFKSDKLNIFKLVKEGGTFKPTLPETGFGKFVAKSAGGRAILKDILTESKEEGLQYLTQKTLEYKYGAEVSKDMTESISHGFKELFGTKEGIENMLIGAILGGGSHLGKAVTGNAENPYTAKVNKSNVVADLANRYFSDDNNKLRDLVSNVGVYTAANERKEYYLSKDDIFNYKNEESQEFASMVKSFADLGAMDVLYEQVDEITSMNDEEYNKMFGQAEDVKVTKSREELSREIKEKAEALDRINTNINTAFNNHIPAYKNNLFYVSAMIDDGRRREAILKNELSEVTGIQYEDFAKLRTQNYKDRELAKIEKSNKTPEEKQKAIDELESLNKETLDDAYSKAINNWITDNNPDLTDTEIKTLTTKLDDLTRLHDRRQNFIDTYNYMVSEKGMENTTFEGLSKSADKDAQESIKELQALQEKFQKDINEGKLNKKEIDKAIIDAEALYKLNGRESFNKLKKNLTKLRDNYYNKKGSDNSSNPTGKSNNTKNTKVEDTSDINETNDDTSVAEPTQEEVDLEQVMADTELEDINDEVIEEGDVKNVSELRNSNLSQDQEGLILDALDEANKLEDTEGVDEVIKSPKKVSGDQAKKAFIQLFDRLSPNSIFSWNLSNNMLYDFGAIMEKINDVAVKNGKELSPQAFQVLQGFYFAYVYSTAKDQAKYKNPMSYKYADLESAEIAHQNRVAVTVHDVNKKYTKDVAKEDLADMETRRVGRVTENAHRTVSAFNRAYEKVKGENKFRDLNNTIVNLAALDFNKVNVGSTITLRIPKKVEHTVDGIPKGKAEILQRALNKENLTKDELRQLTIEMVDEDGNTIGYLHTEEWVDNKFKMIKENHPDHYSDEKLQEEMDNLLSIRASVYLNGSVKTTVTGRSNGILLNWKSDNTDAVTISAKTAFQDDNLKFGIGDSGRVEIGNNRSSNDIGEELTNPDKVVDGITYAVLPVNKNTTTNQVKYISVPLQSIKIGNLTDEQKQAKIKSSIVNAIRIYITNANPDVKVKLSVEDQNVVKDLKKAGYDITTSTGLNNYLQNFIYTFKTVGFNSEDKAGELLRTFLKSKSTTDVAIKAGTKYIEFGSGDANGAGENYVAKITKKGVEYYIGGERVNLSKQDSIDEETFFKALGGITNKAYIASDSKLINKKGKFNLNYIVDGKVETKEYKQYNDYLKENFLTDIYGHTTKEGKTYYSIHPIIEFDDSFIKGKQNTKQVADTISETEGKAEKEVRAKAMIERAITEVMSTGDIMVGEETYTLEEILPIGKQSTEGVTTIYKDSKGKKVKVTVPITDIVDQKYSNNDIADLIYARVRTESSPVEKEITKETPSEQTGGKFSTDELDDIASQFGETNNTNDEVINAPMRVVDDEIFNLEVDLGIRHNPNDTKPVYKRWLQRQYKAVLKKAIELNSKLKDTSYKVKIIKIEGEVGDNRVYFALKAVRRVDEQVINSLIKEKDLSTNTLRQNIDGTLYIADLNLALQNSTIGDLKTAIIRRLKEVRGNRSLEKQVLETSLNDALQGYIDLRNQFISAKNQSTDKNRIAQYDKTITGLTDIINNFDTLAKFAINELASINLLSVSTKIKLEGGKIKTQEVEKTIDNNILNENDEDDPDTGVEDMDSNGEDTAHFETEHSIKIDHKKTISKELKLFLSDITNDKIGRTIFGKALPMRFDTVYNDVLNALSNKLFTGYKTSFEGMLSELEKASEQKPYLMQVVEKLKEEAKDDKSKIPAQFERLVFKHKSEMFYIGYSYRKDNSSNNNKKYKDNKKYYYIVPARTNNLYNERVLVDSWISNFRMGQYTTVDDNYADSILSAEKFGKLKKDYYKIADVIDTQNTLYKNAVENDQFEKAESHMLKLKQAIKDAFGVTGIMLSNETVDIIANNKFKIGNNTVTVANMFKVGNKNVAQAGGRFTRFVKNLKFDKPLSTFNIFSSSFVESIAALESNYNNVDFSSNYLDQEGKSISSNSNYKFLVERVITLLDNPVVDNNTKETIWEKLDNIPFIRNSRWFNDLKEGKLNRDNFHVTYSDAIVPFNKSDKAVKIKNAPEADIENYKLGHFFNMRSEPEQELVRFIYPTLSDGGTVMEVTAMAQDFELDDNNQVSQNTISSIVDQIVMPEVDRIKDVKDKTIDIEGYNEGSKLFLFFPELNKKSNGLFDNDGNLKLDVKGELPLESVKTIRKVVKKYINNLVDNKINEWIDFGILRESPKGIRSEILNYDKDNLITETQLENVKRWNTTNGLYVDSEQVKYKDSTGKEVEIRPEDVIFVYDTDASGSLRNITSAVAKKRYGAKDGYVNRVVGNSFGIVTLADENADIKDMYLSRNEVREAFQKVVDAANKNPDKYFVLPTFRNSFKQFGYNTFEYAQILSTLALPENIVINEKFAKTISKARTSLLETTPEELESRKEKSKAYIYKDHILHFVDKNYSDRMEIMLEGTNKNRIKQMALDYVLNYMVANTNIHQLIIGDPALYFKKANENLYSPENAIATFDNVIKRLAADRAPGEHMANSFAVDEVYKQVFVLDRKKKLASLANTYLKSLGFDYSEINGTDAQEMTTFKEDMYVKYRNGIISKALYNRLFNKNGIVTKELNRKDSNGKPNPNHYYMGAIYGTLSKEDSDLYKEFKENVNQPVKPVYVNNLAQTIDGHNVDRRMYIKSSSFALTPSLTMNRELDKVRIYMESNGIDRLAFGSAVKVGNFATNPRIFNNDGTITIPDDFDDYTMELPRSGFRIQQDNPFDVNKNKVKFGVQESALLFNNLLHIDKFKDLSTRFNDTYSKLYQLELGKLYTQLGILEEGQKLSDLNETILDTTFINDKINLEKLSALVKEEASARGYSRNDIVGLGLKDGEFFIRLGFHTRAINLESLFNSIINNRVISHKITGKSFILGTEEGFKHLEDKKLRDNIVYTSDIVDDLKPMGFTDKDGNYIDIKDVDKDSKFQPAQIFIPSILRDNNGKKINLFEKDIETKSYKYLMIVKRNGQNKLVLRKNMVDSDLFKAFGFRIPTQGHNSMTSIEIAGFLPEDAGDLIIAPRDFVKQMGSDFDVDKLYSYMYNMEVNEDGKIKKVKSGNDSKKALQNQLLDIHFGVLNDPNVDVQKQIFEPLEFGILKMEQGEFISSDKDVEKAVNNMYNGKLADYIDDLNSTRDKMFTGIDDMFQRQSFLEGRDGGVGIGKFSLDSTFNALLQQTKVEIGKETVKGFKPDSVTLGNKVSNHIYDAKSNKIGDKEFNKSQVISWYQSASVDNAKEKLLYKLNINDVTYGAITYLNQLGFNEEIIWLINQPIIRDYVRELQIVNSSINSVDDYINRATLKVYEKYNRDRVFSKEDGTDKLTKTYNNPGRYGIGELHKLLKQNKEGIKDNTADEFNRSQLGIFKIFKDFSKKGDAIADLQSVLNSNSKGMGKDVATAYIKTKAILEIDDNVSFYNPSQLIGTKINEIKYRKLEPEQQNQYFKIEDNVYIKPTTIAGMASIFGTIAGTKLWSSIFPYNSPIIGREIDKIHEISNFRSKHISTEAKDIKHLWTELKKFINSKTISNISTESPNEIRNRLMLDRFDGDNNHTHYSLASIIKAGKENGTLTSNDLVNTLILEPKKNRNSFALVKYNTNGKNIDESNLINGFMQLIHTNKKIGDFNGVEYTTRNLAADLLLYSLTAGGVQQFGRFAKYVPMEYLDKVGYTEAINSLDFTNPYIAGYTEMNEDHNNISEFVTQYFQHFPTKTQKVNLSNSFMFYDNSLDLDDLKQIQLDKLNIEDSVLVEGVPVSKEMEQAENRRLAFIRRIYRTYDENDDSNNELKEFFHVQHPDTNKVYLFRLINKKDGTYAKIPTLGQQGISEYNYDSINDNNYQNSVLNNNNDKLITFRDPTLHDKKASYLSQSDLTDNRSLIDNYNINSLNAKTILRNIIKHKQDRINRNKLQTNDMNNQLVFNSFIAEKILDRIDNFDIKIVIDNTIKASGQITSTDNYANNITIKLNLQDINSYKNNQVVDTVSIEDASINPELYTFERVFLHEGLHAITLNYLKTTEESNLSILQGNWAKARTYAQNNGVNIKELDRLVNTPGASLPADMYKYYGLAQTKDGKPRLDEFITGVFTDAEFRNFLSGIDSDTKSVLDKILEFIVNALNEIGFNIKENTLAESSLLEIINVIEESDFPVKKKNVNVENDSINSVLKAFGEENLDNIINDLIKNNQVSIACKL